MLKVDGKLKSIKLSSDELRDRLPLWFGTREEAEIIADKIQKVHNANVSKMVADYYNKPANRLDRQSNGQDP